jgi:hypothetical protein
MNGPAPIVRYMIVCDDVVNDPQRPQKPVVVGLTCRVNSTGQPPYPTRLERLTVFLVLTDARGAGTGWIRIIFEETEELIFETGHRTLQFGNDPLRLAGVKFQILDCPFPRLGIYRAEFWYNNECLTHQILECR